MFPMSDSIVPNHLIASAIQKMKNLGLGYLPVMEQGQVVGLLSQQDIVERCATHQMDPSKFQVRDVMRKGPFVCQENQSIEDTIQQMDQNNTDHVIVLNEFHQVVGLVVRDEIIATFPSLGFGRS